MFVLSEGQLGVGLVRFRCGSRLCVRLSMQGVDEIKWVAKSFKDCLDWLACGTLPCTLHSHHFFNLSSVR